MKSLMSFTILFLSLYAHSQNSIKGHVFGDEKEALYGATVMLLQESDSTMLDFCLTNDSGQYIFYNIDSGKYILQVTYIGLSNYSEYIDITDSSGKVELAAIVLERYNEILQEIKIQAEHIPMGIRGDTISYNASAFKARPNATVEDLLKKLPGIDVERNGNIKAQGEDVKKVLVDGKEFFGSDPKMATKNLQAEAVEKVEVFGKKSEIAEFTGIDDGEENKTINLKLKEDFKKGGFGNAKAKKGTKGTYDSKFNYFRFNQSMQVSIIAASNNINEQTFTITDRIDFLGGIGGLLSSGGLNFADTGRLEDGLNTSTSIGVNYNHDISPKVKFNTHYIYNSVDNILNGNRDIENLNGRSQFLTQNIADINKNLRSHAINTKLTHKVNPLFELIFKNNLSFKDDTQNENSLRQYYQDGFNFGNTSSINDLKSHNFNFDSHTSIRKKFKKRGRNIISTVLFKRSSSTSDDRIDNIDNLTGIPFRIHQVQDYRSVLDQLNLSSNYTEIISDKLHLGVEYKYASSIETPSRDYFNVVNSENILDDKLSSDYRKEYFYHIGSLSLRKNSKRLKTKIGLKRQWISLNGIINEGESRIEGTYGHWLPSLSLDFKMKRNKNAELSYNTSVIVPSLEQLLPLPVNTNPNFNYIGNPSLIPEYTHNIGMEFNFFDNFNFTNLFSNISFSVSKNRIVNRTDINSQLFRSITPINTDEYKNARAFFSFNRPFRPLKINYSIITQFIYAQYNSFLNGLESPVSDSNIDIKFSVQNRNTDSFFFDAGMRWNRSDISYEINQDFDQSYFDLNYFLDTEFYLPVGFTIGSELHYNRYSSDGFSNNPRYYLWTASVSKLFFDNKIELRLSAYDILNQNIGYRRFASATSISEESYQNLSQYYMISFNYKIGKGNKNDGIQIQIDE